jgi:predicted  nucleic acid-binding Zn-ribbon protein
MGPTLEALHRLQEIETQLRSVREQIQSKRRTVQAHQRRVATLDRQMADTHDQIRTAQAEADRLELDRKTHESHIAKLRDALNKSKTNKEYAAVLTQLNTDKADMVKIEDAVLSAMSKVEELKKHEAELRASRDREQARGGELEKSAQDTETRLSARLKDLEAQRESASEGIPREALSLFERACEAHEGEGMAAIEQAHPKRQEFTCSGCNMSITLETINALQSRDVVVQCHTCTRILYLESSRAGVGA